ncbi:MAG: 30S ribosomal protein S4 [Candidatus Thermoplasmatota archaeon]|jgi:small subunit ribosomal protein S4|nr:30S ribosomal protein S4 [Candidatus Thermoplasmatota archaeon]
MGDQKFPRKTYSTPRHPWEKNRIDSEKIILEKYGLKNKRELWKSQSILENYRTQARDLQAKLRTENPSAEKQFSLLINKLNRYSILSGGANLDDVLSLNIENVLERRLQTVVYNRKLSGTVKQARQLITHGHIILNGRRVTIPGLIVERALEDTIAFNPDSAVSDPDHPIRRVIDNSEEEERPTPGIAAEEAGESPQQAGESTE